MLIIVAARENAKAKGRREGRSGKEREQRRTNKKNCILFTAHSIETSERETPA